MYIYIYLNIFTYIHIYIVCKHRCKYKYSRNLCKERERKGWGKELKGKRTGLKGLCVVWGKGVIANFASCMYATMRKTKSNVDIMHNCRYRFWGEHITTHCVWYTFQTQSEQPLRKSSFNGLFMSFSCALHAHRSATKMFYPYQNLNVNCLSYDMINMKPN